MADEIKHPETADLVRRAMEASGTKTQDEFLALFGGAIPKRTFLYWLYGERPAGGLASLVFREMIGGWRPSPTATREKSQ